MRVGVDVGGTNTDAVLMDGRDIVSTYKASTSLDITSGIVEAVSYLLNDGKVAPEALESVMIGTTHFTNAFVERRDLLPVAVMRLAGPSGQSVYPKIGWPADLSEAIGDHVYLLSGGYEFDGRELSAFDPVAVRDAAKEIARKGLRAVAISSVYASINSEMEAKAAEIVREENPGCDITLSSDIGRTGLLERENSAIMNAACSGLARTVVKAFGDALASLNINAPFYISQNDGTLITAKQVERFPIFTFASGPTNSIRGAAFLSGIEDGMVMDIGGTTCDVGVLQQGFPRESSIDVDIGGIRTNFRMPDILAIGVGGGTRIHREGDSFKIGPDSVGYELTKRGLIFGGDTLTATDIAVAANPSLSIGSREKLAHLEPGFVGKVQEKIVALCSEALDRMKTAAGNVPVILVGGGHVLIDRDLPGASETIRPPYAEVANAVGAAIAQVGGEVDQLYSYQQHSRESAIGDAKQKAVEMAVKAGGIRETVKIVEVEEIPMSYVPGDMVRIKIKAVADLERAHELT